VGGVLFNGQDYDEWRSTSLCQFQCVRERSRLDFDQQSDGRDKNVTGTEL